MSKPNVNLDLIQKYNQPGPRYTSYPPAPQFTERVTWPEVAAKIGRERGIEDGYRTVYNVGPRSGQSVFHLHLHLLGGRDLKWPPG